MVLARRMILPTRFKLIVTARSRLTFAFGWLVPVMGGTQKMDLVTYAGSGVSAFPLRVPATAMRPVDEEETPASFALDQNYPNPFNPTTTIQFTLPNPAVVTLNVYNTLGQVVATVLDNEDMDEGEQEAEFDASGLGSGVYFYRIVAVNTTDDGGDAVGQRFVSVKKMLLLK